MAEHGEFLKQARLKKGWTLRELGAKIGRSDATIQSIEAGRQRGSFDILLKLAGALGIPPNLVLDKANLNIMLIPSPHGGGIIAEASTVVDLETHNFSELSKPVKKFLLDLAPIVEKHLGISR